jgi:hypothetical protein
LFLTDPARRVQFPTTRSDSSDFGIRDTQVCAPTDAFRYNLSFYDDSSNDSAPSSSSDAGQPFQMPSTDDELRRIAEEQLDSFLKQPSKEDVLLWWKSTGSLKYWLLAPVARWCFSILASSAPVERNFKCAKYVTREERGRTGDELVDALAVLSYTFRKFPRLYELYIETGRLHDNPEFGIPPPHTLSKPGRL